MRKNDLTIAGSAAEISINGQWVKVPALTINDNLLIIRGKWIRIAAVHDEQLAEREVEHPDKYIEALKGSNSRSPLADIFSFTQRPTDPVPHFNYSYEWDSVAAISITSYLNWWNSAVSTDLRKDVRRAAKRGIIVRNVPFTDDLVLGIMGIYNETPIRQGRPFWHFKKSFEEVKRANATYLERSEFVGAYLGDELVGFVKIIYVGRFALFMQILAKHAQREQRPMNALVAKTVELVAAKGCSHLIYGKYRYAQGADSLTAFKHRNGFEEILVPKYYVPLTLKGWLALRLHLHHDVKEMLPNFVRRPLMRVRVAAFNVKRAYYKRT